MTGPGDERRWIGALAKAGAIVALVRRDGTTLVDGLGAKLVDPAALARAAAAAPITVEIEGASIELRTVPFGEDLLLVGRDRSERRDLAALDELISYASHELKGPLHVLGLACHLIDARIGRGEKIETASVEQIRRQLNRLTRQLNELLDVGRLRQRRLELSRESFDLAEVVREAVGELNGPRVADVQLSAPSGPLAVRGDRARAAEIVAELIDNALRFTPDGTRIEVRLQGTAREAIFSVTDEGPGVAEADRAGLFELASALHTTRKGRVGLGLGLHLARAIARQQGGDVEFAPGVERGARFTLRVPR
jgi:signal transduction histidine kinase